MDSAIARLSDLTAPIVKTKFIVFSSFRHVFSRNPVCKAVDSRHKHAGMTVEVIDYVMPEVVIGHPEKYHKLLRLNSGGAVLI